MHRPFVDDVISADGKKKMFRGDLIDVYLILVRCLMHNGIIL
jgi:hypothetical protein